VTERRQGYFDFLGVDAPFSKGMLARVLTTVGVPEDRAYELARRTESDLGDRRASSVDLDRLRELAVEVLGEEVGSRTARRLRRFRVLNELDQPVILLVGGGTGTGKSTVATEVAYRLGITRVTSTDFVRQTMRAFFSQEFMPTIHFSSFEAALGLSKAEEEESGDAALLGFLDQTRNVLVGVEAALQRALDEGWSMVLEGVHLVPGMLATEVERALVVQCVLAIHDEEIHRTHFWHRDVASAGLRAGDKYLSGLPEIRMIQEYIVERARRNDVAVIENERVADVISAVIELVLEQAERHTYRRQGVEEAPA
jgi:2-phosphoglycerate kinase